MLCVRLVPKSRVGVINNSVRKQEFVSFIKIAK